MADELTAHVRVRAVLRLMAVIVAVRVAAIIAAVVSPGLAVVRCGARIFSLCRPIAPLDTVGNAGLERCWRGGRAQVHALLQGAARAVTARARGRRGGRRW